MERTDHHGFAITSKLHRHTISDGSTDFHQQSSIDEPVVKHRRQRLWVYAAMNPATREVLPTGVYAVRTSLTTKAFFTGLQDRYGTLPSTVVTDGEASYRAVLDRLPVDHGGYDLGLVTPEEALGLVEQIRTQREEQTPQFIDMISSADLPEEEREWMIEENLKLPDEQAATLAFNLFHMDWRDVIPQIDVPTLVVGAKESHLNWKAQEWVADRISDAELELFEDQAHLLFYEDHERFNDILTNFLRN